MITILVGKSAAGKDTIFQEMLKRGVKPLISCTTRPMRPGEQEGKEYFFKTKEDFLSLVENGSIFEYRSYDTLVNNVPATWYYGSVKQELDPAEGYVAVLELAGAMAYVKAYGPEACRVIYLDVSDEERKRRAMLRGGFDPVEWNRRAETDALDFAPENIRKLQDILKGNFVLLRNE